MVLSFTWSPGAPGSPTSPGSPRPPSSPSTPLSPGAPRQNTRYFLHELQRYARVSSCHYRIGHSIKSHITYSVLFLRREPSAERKISMNNNEIQHWGERTSAAQKLTWCSIESVNALCTFSSGFTGLSLWCLNILTRLTWLSRSSLLTWFSRSTVISLQGFVLIDITITKFGKPSNRWGEKMDHYDILAKRNS